MKNLYVPSVENQKPNDESKDFISRAMGIILNTSSEITSRTLL